MIPAVVAIGVAGAMFLMSLFGWAQGGNIQPLPAGDDSQQNQVMVLQQRIQDLEQRARDSEQEREQERDKLISGFEQEVGRLRGELARANDRIEELEKDNGELQSSANLMDHSLAKIAESEKEARESADRLQGKVDRLQEELDKHQVLIDLGQKNAAKLVEAQRLLGKAWVTIGKQKEQLGEKDKALAVASENLDAVKASLAVSEGKLEKAQSVGKALGLALVVALALILALAAILCGDTVQKRLEKNRKEVAGMRRGLAAFKSERPNLTKPGEPGGTQEPKGSPPMDGGL